MSIHLYHTQLAALDSLEDYIETNEYAFAKKISGSQASDLRLTSMVQIYVYEEEGKTTYHFGEGILSFAADYTSEMDNDGSSSVEELVGKVHARLSARISGLPLAVIIPYFYTVEEGITYDAGDYRPPSQERIEYLVRQIVDEDGKSPDEARYEVLGVLAVLDRCMQGPGYAVRGLSEDERKLFDCLNEK